MGKLAVIHGYDCMPKSLRKRLVITYWNGWRDTKLDLNLCKKGAGRNDDTNAR